jgi:hypothetical protein
VPTGYLTDCMDQSHFWQANTHPSRPLNIFSALLRQQFHYRVHNNPPPVRVLNQIIRISANSVPATSVLILSFINACVFQTDCFLQVTHHQCVGINTHTCHKPNISHSPWCTLELLIVICLLCLRLRIEAKNIFNLRHVRMSLHLYRRGSFWSYICKIWY